LENTFKILSEPDAPDILTSVSGSDLTGISGGNDKIIPLAPQDLKCTNAGFVSNPTRILVTLENGDSILLLWDK
jgi:hypothetical protein